MKSYMLKLIWIFLAITLGFSSCISAQANLLERQLLFSTIRERGMGGASVAIPENEAALYQNPAALVRVKKSNLKFPRLLMGLGDAIFSFQDDLDALSNGSDISDQLDQLVKITEEGFDTGAQFSVNPILSYSRHNFGFGAFSEGILSARLIRPESPVLEFQAMNDTAGIVGFGKEVQVRGNGVAIGVSAKLINRVSLYDTANDSTTVRWNEDRIIYNINNDFDDKPDVAFLSGFGMDFGALLESPWWNGNIGFLASDIVSSLSGEIKTFDGEKVRDISSAHIPTTFKVGASVDLTLPIVKKVLLAGDYRLPTGDNGDASIYKSLYLGAEKKIYNRFALRGGLKQGNVVGGVGIDLGLIHASYAYDVVELGNEITERTVKYPVVLQVGVLF